MGTRNLTLVRLDEQYRIAQYGQWDGKPSGQGAIVHGFLQTWDRAKFEEKLRATSFLLPSEIDVINEELRATEEWPKKYDYLSRDTGAKILEIIQNREAALKLKNSLYFAGNSILCEWAYVLDLDKNKLEVYKGSNRKKLTKKDRFFEIPVLDYEKKYKQVKIVESYNIANLPPLEKFIADLS